MSHIDAMFEKLRAAPLPTRLMMIDDAVLYRLSERQANATPLSGSVIGFAVVAALGMGIAGAVFPSAPAEAARTVSPLGAPAALAPSTLLDSSE